MTEKGFGLADVVVDFGRAVMGSFLHPFQARQGFHICSARTFPTAPPNPVRGSLSVAVGDAAAPTTPLGVAHRARQCLGNPLNMNPLRGFEPARGHPLQIGIPYGDELPRSPPPPPIPCCPSARCGCRRRFRQNNARSTRRNGIF